MSINCSGFSAEVLFFGAIVICATPFLSMRTKIGATSELLLVEFGGSEDNFL